MILSTKNIEKAKMYNDDKKNYKYPKNKNYK